MSNSSEQQSMQADWNSQLQHRLDHIRERMRDYGLDPFDDEDMSATFLQQCLAADEDFLEELIADRLACRRWVFAQRANRHATRNRISEYYSEGDDDFLSE